MIIHSEIPVSFTFQSTEGTDRAVVL